MISLYTQGRIAAAAPHVQAAFLAALLPLPLLPKTRSDLVKYQRLCIRRR